jgi:hypothetical protein
MRMKLTSLIAIGVVFLTSLFSTQFAQARSTIVNWNGSGITSNGSGGYNLNTSLCSPAVGAAATGNYLLFL